MKQRSKHAQNKISYIVYSNPDGVRSLLDQYGYDAPKNIHDLDGATRELVKEQGVQFINDLLLEHPEREAIIETVEAGKDKYHNYCGACGASNFNGEEPIPVDGMTTPQLERYYEELKAEAKEFPGDSVLTRQIELVWHTLNQRKSSDQEQPQDPAETGDEEEKITVSKGQLAVAGLVFAAAVIVARAIP